MLKRIAKAGLTSAVMLLFVATAAMAGGGAVIVNDGISGFPDQLVSPDVKKPHTKHFKLNGAGQIDTTTFSLEFSGKAQPIGKYDATGQFDPSTGALSGVLTTSDDHHCADGDSINWTATFVFGPIGDIQASFTFSGGTGKFANETGTASGPVVLDTSDYMFTIALDGTITY